MTKQNITECEIVVMNALWLEGRDKTLMETLDIINAQYQKYWKSQTVSTFLKRLIDKGYVSYHRKGRQYIYHAEVDKKECFQQELMRYADLWGYGADRFMSALINGKIE